MSIVLTLTKNRKILILNWVNNNWNHPKMNLYNDFTLTDYAVIYIFVSLYSWQYIKAITNKVNALSNLEIGMFNTN